MAITNHERVGKALDLLKAGPGPFVQREVQGAIESGRQDAHRLHRYADDTLLAKPARQKTVFNVTTFSALQSAAQWVRDTTLEAPLQRSMYERRCGERLEAVQERKEWGDRDEDAVQQTKRIREWTRLGTPTGHTA